MSIARIQFGNLRGHARTPLAAPIAVLSVVTLIAVLLGPDDAADTGLAQDIADQGTSSASGAEEPPPRLREGATLNNEVGRFGRQGGRYTFATADGRYKLVVVENLALERVAQLENNRFGAYQWTVSGEVTEFQGKNYLLIRRATTNHRIDSPSSGSDSI